MASVKFKNVYINNNMRYLFFFLIFTFFKFFIHFIKFLNFCLQKYEEKMKPKNFYQEKKRS